MVKIFRFKSLEAESITGGVGTFTTLLATVNGLATTPTQGLTLRNSTAAANGAQQVSPFLSLAGQGWNTTSSTSQEAEFAFHLVPAQGNPITSTLVLRSRHAGGAFENAATFYSRNASGLGTVLELSSQFGTIPLNITGNGLDIAGGARLTIRNALFMADAGGGSQSVLHTEANNTFAQRNGAAAQEFRIYGQYSGTSNFERLSLKYNSTATAFQIGTEKGTGSPSGNARPLQLQVDGTTRVDCQTTGSVVINGTTFFAAGGASGSNFNANNRCRIGDAGVSCGSESFITFHDGTFFHASGADTRIRRVSAGLLEINNVTAGTYRDLVLRALMVGGTTASFPALRNSSTTLQVRLANDSDFAPFTAGLITATGNLVLTDNTGAETATFDAQSKLTANRTYDLPDASGTVALAVDVFDFDYSTTNSSATGGSGTWTWTVPATAKFLHLWIVSGGGGGGSGRRGAAGSNRTGGAGGHSASITETWCKKSNLSNTLTITIGAGGAGGAAQTVDDTNGNNGTNGGTSSVSSLNGLTMSVSPNSGAVMRGGVEGTSTPAAGGNFSVGSLYGADTGAAGSSGTGGTRQINTVAPSHLQGGSGGGGISSSNVASGGGFNFNGTVSNIFGTQQGGGGGVNTGGNGGDAPANNAIVGGSGSGGGANLTGAGGRGGNGYRGGGGGGGGASVNGNNSGAGGNGGNGFVRITVFY